MSLINGFFYYLRCDSRQTTNKARYDAICVQECPNFNIKKSDGVPGCTEKNLGLLGSDHPPLGPCYIDTSILLENIPPVKFIKTTSGTPMVYFPHSHTGVLSMT